MIRVKKLKTDKDIKGLLPAIFSIIAGACAAVIFGPAAGLKTIGVIILVYATFGVIAVFRTSALTYKISTVYLYCLGLYIVFLEIDKYAPRMFYLSIEAKFLIIWVAFFWFWLIYLVITKRAKWRGRDIMEAAAESVEAGDYSYTPRPRPGGKVETTKEELFAFGNYLKKNLVVMPFYNSDKIILVLVKMGEEYGILFGPNVNYLDRTWVSIDFEGNLAVNISKEYYLDFKENLSFDHLCESFSSLFIRFFDYYKKGEEIRIIDNLNEMKVGPFS